MIITERKTNDIVVLDLEGRLTIGEGADLLRDRISGVVAQGHSKVLLNLAGVPYIDSGGLGELVRCSLVAQRANGAVKLIGVSGRVVDLLTITKLITVFDTFDTEQEAVASFMAVA
ncbi:MAG: STAS domain-containing protein [Cyanobacteria bacterium]|nr:STAS domain-containing protein [Cyanobacteriota bacterium]